MLGSFDNDISGQFTGSSSQDFLYDLEILEEYLAGVLLPPLTVEVTEPLLEESMPVEFAQFDASDTLPQQDIEIAEEQTVPSFTTSTMAEIYVSQGFIQRAIDIYEEMLRENPSNDGIVQRIGELMDMLVPPVEDQPLSAAAVISEFAPESLASAPSGEHEVVSTLEQWLSNIKSSRRR